MLHEALSRPSCQLATNSCYQPLLDLAPESGAGPSDPVGIPRRDATRDETSQDGSTGAGGLLEGDVPINHVPDSPLAVESGGIGYEGCLHVIWNLGALRMVDIPADASDKDPQKRIERGYDENGHPLC